MKNKKIFIAFIFLLWLDANIFAQSLKYQNLDTFNCMELNCVVNKLFDISHVDIVNQPVFIWSPNYSEKHIFNISFDEKCHTSLDTILLFKNNSNRDSRILIFKTQSYERVNAYQTRVVGSHFSTATISVAIFSKVDDGWQLNAFQKYFTDSGLFGGEGKEGIGKFSVLKIDGQIYLSFKRPVAGNNGFNEGIEELYYVDGDLPCKILQNVFKHIYYQENGEKTTTQKIDTIKSTKEFIWTTNNLNNDKKYIFNRSYCQYNM